MAMCDVIISPQILAKKMQDYLAEYCSNGIQDSKP